MAAGLGVLAVLSSLGCSASSSTSKPSDAGSPSDAGNQTTTPWKQVWSDTFNGPANSSVNTRLWEFNTGQGIFGTGEVETNTSSLDNVHLDGHGHLDIVALNNGAAGSAGWTSARIRTKKQFEAPAGGEMMVTASIKQPGPVNPLGYWPGFWMLRPGRWPETG